MNKAPEFPAHTGFFFLHESKLVGCLIVNAKSTAAVISGQNKSHEIKRKHLICRASEEDWNKTMKLADRKGEN